MARRGRGRDFIEPPEEEKKSEISYMQPEILPVHIMEAILKERGFSMSSLNIDRKSLIKIFYHHVSPKYQREYRENRRGKILKRMRQRRERKIDSEDWKSMIMDSKTTKSSSLPSFSPNHGSSRDRLKPPPAYSSNKSSTKNLDEIVIKDHKVRSNRDESNTDKERKRRDEEAKRDKRSGDDSVNRDTKKVKLSSSSISSDKRKSDGDSNSSSKKLKLKRDISWP